MFPRVAKHKLVTLRQELIDAFVEYVLIFYILNKKILLLVIVIQV